MTHSLLSKVQWTEDDPDADSIGRLCQRLAEADGTADLAGVWSETLWSLLKKAGACLWSLPERYGGKPVARALLVQRYAQLAAGSLTAVFILSQHDAALRRLAAAGTATSDRWLGAVGDGRAFVTVGISHLTTSRRSGVAAAAIAPGCFRIDGAMPWVTGATAADLFVTGAVLDDCRQMFVALPADRPGVSVCPPFALAALQASCTAQVVLENVDVADYDLLAGPALDLSSQPGAVGTAGLETSALALGQAHAALDAIVKLSPARTELTEPVEVLCDHWQSQWRQLMALARGAPDAGSASQLRTQANSLVLRATQAYLTASKGTGFLLSEPAQRWARQALFFLVWSCPAPVAEAAIRDLAGICQQ
jgi:alkylation response protein AidB-like acyl-CoA dehydrogenase